MTPGWGFDLEPLRRAAGLLEIPAGFERARACSGKTAAGDVCGGTVLFQPVQAGAFWRWVEAGQATPADREKWPTWSGLADGDPVTRGHVQALEGRWS